MWNENLYLEKAVLTKRTILTVASQCASVEGVCSAVMANNHDNWTISICRWRQCGWKCQNRQVLQVDLEWISENPNKTWFPTFIYMNLDLTANVRRSHWVALWCVQALFSQTEFWFRRYIFVTLSWWVQMWSCKMYLLVWNLNKSSCLKEKFSQRYKIDIRERIMSRVLVYNTLLSEGRKGFS